METQQITENTKPTHLWYCLYAFLASTLISFIDFLLQNIEVTEQTLPISFGGFIAGTLINLLFIWLVFKRKNWARIIYAIFIIISIPVVLPVISVELQSDIIGAISSILQLLLNVSSVVFLFTKQTNVWFKNS